MKKYCYIVIDNCKEKVFPLVGLISELAELYRNNVEIIVGGFYGFCDDTENNFDNIIEQKLIPAIRQKLNEGYHMHLIIDLLLKKSEETDCDSLFDSYIRKKGKPKEYASGIVTANSILNNIADSFDRINITFMTRWFDYQISPLSTFNGLEKNKRYWNSHDIYCFLNPVDEDGHMNNKSFVEPEDNAKDIIEYMDNIIFRGLGKGGNG